jgi:hypothetical protein
MFTEDESRKQILKIAAAGLGLLLVIAVGLWLYSRKDLPKYRDMDIQEWLHKLRLGSARDRQEAYDSIKAMGAPALEFVKEEAAGERSVEHKALLEELVRDLEVIKMLGPGGGKPKVKAAAPE